MTRKVLRVLSLLPIGYLVVGVSVFVVSGVDIMPGYDGLRWFILAIFSLLGIAAFLDLQETKR